MVFSALLIWKHEGRMISRNRSNGDHQEAAGCLFEDEIWVTCSKSVHPVWLLAYRIIAFSALLALLLADITIHGAVKYFFYTEWAFTLVTVYFGGKVERERHTCMDADNGSYVPPSLMVMENAARHIQNEKLSHCGEPNCKTAASFWGYALQIIFQMCAGAVPLTDSVFWLIIYPYLTAKDYRLNFVALSFSGLIISICSIMGYLAVGLLLFPCFGIFTLVLLQCEPGETLSTPSAD
ncbi:hypothetical protein OROGR_001474 [Orobanche gracilis]